MNEMNINRIVCFFIRHDIVSVDRYEVCVRCGHDAYYNEQFYLTIPDLAGIWKRRFRNKVKRIFTKKYIPGSELPF